MMIQRILVILLCSIFFAPVYAEPTNLAVIKLQLKRYHDDGSYEKEFRAVVNKALKDLKVTLKQNQSAKRPKKLAMVFDIDETVLSNYADIEYMNFGGSVKAIDYRIAEARAPALIPTQQLYEFARANKITLFFVTGRHAHLQEATIRNLKKAGFHGWQKIYFKPNNYQQKSVIPFKSNARRTITSQGYEIVAAIGDQWSDLRGGYAQHIYKLPNPFYYLP